MPHFEPGDQAGIGDQGDIWHLGRHRRLHAIMYIGQVHPPNQNTSQLGEGHNNTIYLAICYLIHNFCNKSIPYEINSLPTI